MEERAKDAIRPLSETEMILNRLTALEIGLDELERKWDERHMAPGYQT